MPKSKGACKTCGKKSCKGCKGGGGGKKGC